MDFQVGDKGIITFGDETTSKVEVTKIQTYPISGMPPDVFFTYQEGEFHQPIKHPILGLLVLPIGLAEKVFTKQ